MRCLRAITHGALAALVAMPGGIAGCGIDVVGEPLGDDGGAIIVGAEAGIVPPGPPGPPGPPAADGGGDAPLDAPSSPMLAIAIANAPTTPTQIDLTAEGTMDWAYWGYNSSATPVRRNGGGIIGSFTTVGASPNAFQGSGWQMLAKWTNGDNPATASSVDGFVYFNNANDILVTFAIPANATKREFAFYAGMSSIQWSVTASLADGSIANATSSQDTPNGASAAIRALVTYASATPTTLTVKFHQTARHNTTQGASFAISAATLK